MNSTLISLKDWGCDVDSALARFMGNEDLYLSFIPRIALDPAFDKLGDALKENRVEDAFHEAHTLKGVFANMGLTPLFNKSVEIVEPLRAGNPNGIPEKYEHLLLLRAKLQEIAKDLDK